MAVAMVLFIYKVFMGVAVADYPAFPVAIVEEGDHMGMAMAVFL